MPLIVIAAMIGVPAGWFYILVRPAMPRSQLNRLVIGMTKDDVRNVLGEPRENREGSVWVYSRWGNAGWFEVTSMTRVDLQRSMTSPCFLNGLNERQESIW